MHANVSVLKPKEASWGHSDAFVQSYLERVPVVCLVVSYEQIHAAACLDHVPAKGQGQSFAYDVSVVRKPLVPGGDEPVECVDV